MIKFILHGGTHKIVNEDNDSFFKELTSELKGNVKILINCFARDDQEKDVRFERVRDRILNNSSNSDLEFELAIPNNFTKQLKWCDVMFMDGGLTSKLVRELSITPNLKKLFNNKVIGGSSAGVYALMKYYYGNDSKKLGMGLGILPFKAYCHYEPKYFKQVEKLDSYKEKLPLILLPNYKWAVVYL